MVHLYFFGDGEPLTLLVDLKTPTTEATFDREALSLALLTSSPAPSSH